MAPSAALGLTQGMHRFLQRWVRYMITIVLTVLVIIWAVLWVTQVAEVMRLHSADGSYDKPLWVVLFVLAPPLAPFAFLLWRYSAAVDHLSEHTSPTDQPVASHPGTTSGLPNEGVAWLTAVLGVLGLLLVGFLVAGGALRLLS